MDTRLRELERQALIDPEARLQWVEEKKRLGYLEVQHYIAGMEIKGTTYPLDDFGQAVHKKITNKWKKLCHRFAISFHGTGDSCCGSYDCYCDNEVSSIQVLIYGYQLETEAQKKSREKQETAARNRDKKRKDRQAKARKDAQKAQEDRDMQTYLRLKRQIESKEKVEMILSSIGSEATRKLQEYNPAYYKGWFWRKAKKLNNRTPVEVYDAGETDLLRNFALKLI